MGGTQSANSNQKAKDFNWILSSVTDSASVDVCDGLDFTFVQSINKPYSGLLVHSLKILPRIYPVQMAAQAGEPLRAGSYNLVYISKILDMDLRIQKGLTGAGSCELIVPLDEDIKTNLTVNFDLSSIIGYIQASKQKYNIEAAFNSTEYFSKANVTFDFSYQLPKNIVIGALHSRNLFEKQQITRFGYYHTMQKFESGLIVSYDGKLRINKSFAYAPNSRTKGYLQYDFIVSDLVAQMAFGVQRDFMMTGFAANITSAGQISSKIRRNLRNERSITLSAMGDIVQKVFKFGVALTWN